MSEVTLGIVLALVAGVLNGSFAAPTKYVSLWKWENIWAVWALVALLLSPWVLALVTVPALFSLYESAGFRPLLLVVAFGFGTGLAQIFFGLGLAAVGLSLGFAIAIGLSTVVGSLVPFILLQPHLILTHKGLTILGGVALTLMGIVICAVAGWTKEKLAHSSGGPPGRPSSQQSMAKGLIIVILAGVLSPMINFGLAFGGPLLSRAAESGVSPSFQANVIWPPLLTAALIPYLTYCSFLWRKNNSLGLYKLSGTRRYWVFGAIMGLLWTGSMAVYGAASSFMSSMGPILGWPLFMSVIIMTSSIWGFATGEWKGVGRKPVSIMLAGLVFLILGFCTLALASRPS